LINKTNCYFIIYLGDTFPPDEIFLVILSGLPSKEISPLLLAFPSIDEDAYTLVLAPLLTFAITSLETNL
jgi:hypothetical protein